MSIELCILASGSSGNCTAVRTPSGIFLIDCGIGPRTAADRLKTVGVHLDNIRAICLTHLDRDHFNLGWISTLIRRQIPLFCPANRTADLLRITGCRELAPLIQPFDANHFEPSPKTAVRSIRLPHDAEGSHAFHLEHAKIRVGYATDLGDVPPILIDQFCGVDLLAIESNYDPQMQRASGRPIFLQRRITGGRGHLSNSQSLDAVKAIFDRSEKNGLPIPRHVVLLHRSRQCNCPKLISKLFSQDARIAPRLVLAEQHQPTAWLGSRAASIGGEQLRWAWG
jgi:phosphoribosyl 1,2-cyclic phosphodiesterase